MSEVSRLVRRLVDAALAGRRDDQLFGLVCEDLLAHGVPILRAGMGAEFLHPALQVRLLRWICGRGVESETLGREPDDAPEDEAWLASPLYQLPQDCPMRSSV